MSVISDDYYRLLLSNIAELRGISIYGVIQEPGYTQVKNRAALIFSLEAVLHQHREQYGTVWNQLKGREALEHLLLQKYKWHLREIRGLPLCDIVFLLQEELSPDKLPESAKNVLSQQNALTPQYSFPEFIEEEWDPELYLKLPKQRNW